MSADRCSQSLCPDVYTQFPLPLRSIECEDLGDRADRSWKSLGAIVLHELTHWRKLTTSVANVEIDDIVYNPEHFERLQLDADTDLDRPPVENADSYMW